MPPVTGDAPPPVHRGSRRAAARRRRRLTRVLIGATGAVSFALTLFVMHRLDRVAAPAVANTSAQVRTAQAAAPAAAPAHPIFRYSIVPGGVHSPQDVVAAMERDPVVKAHYASVRPLALRVEPLRDTMQAHVSYRVGDAVYWTKRTLTLRAGEPVLTDGSMTIRARCGNIISMEPMAPALENEPAPPVFDLNIQPFAPSGDPFSLDPPPDPEIPIGGAPPMGTPVPFGGPPPGPPSRPPGSVTPFSEPPLPVPEPSTWVLVGIGLATGVARHLRNRAKKTI